MTRNSFYGIQFTRSGWKQFCRVNQTLAARFIRAFILKCELTEYLTAYERAGIPMDTECQEVRYDDGIYLLLRKEQGIWFISDVILSSAPDAFLPIYTVRTVLRGLCGVIMLIFTGWCACIGTSNRKAVIV